MTERSDAPQLRTIETAVAGDGFLFDGKDWHHYVHDELNVASLLRELAALRSETVTPQACICPQCGTRMAWDFAAPGADKTVELGGERKESP